MAPLFSLKEVLSEEEAVKMGRKDPEEEVEKFVSANTQELGKDKWLCPLSGKKFKVSVRAVVKFQQKCCDTFNLYVFNSF